MPKTQVMPKTNRVKPFLPGAVLVLTGLLNILASGCNSSGQGQMTPTSFLLIYSSPTSSEGVLAGTIEGPTRSTHAQNTASPTVIHRILTITPTVTITPSITPRQIAQRPACDRIGETWRSSRDGMITACIPEGYFMMGARSGNPTLSNANTPLHRVNLDAFWMDQTEVTNAMFSQFVADTGYQTEAESTGWSNVFTPNNNMGVWSTPDGTDWRHPNGPSSSIFGLEDYPVVQVTWTDAFAYCQWAGRRLPTEAEWEKAALSDTNFLFPWGNGPAKGDLANFADLNLGTEWADMTVNDGYEYTAPVGSFPHGASPYGTADMVGNVWEWAADWYSDTYYNISPTNNPSGPARGEYRVLRGNSWSDIVLSAAFRGYQDPSSTNNGYGFRCALSAVP